LPSEFVVSSPFHGQKPSFTCYLPVISPVIAIFAFETGSHVTAHTTTQSPQTGRFRYDAE
jgi:hypothetical protein